MRRSSSWRSRWSPRAAKGSADSGVISHWKPPTPLRPRRPNGPFPFVRLGPRLRCPNDIATLTDEDGRFPLYAPVPGNYEIVCHADDLDPATTHIDVDGTSNEIAVDIEMG